MKFHKKYVLDTSEPFMTKVTRMRGYILSILDKDALE
jgi:hypothetical protein